MAYNKTIIQGNCTRDPELKDFGATKLAKFGVAVTEKNSKSEETLFIDVICWNKLAELCHTYLKKGSNLLVEGKLKLEEWNDAVSNSKRTKIILVADQVVFLNNRLPLDKNDSAPMPMRKTKLEETTDPFTGQNFLDTSLPFQELNMNGDYQNHERKYYAKNKRLFNNTRGS